MTKSQHKRNAVASMFQNGISRNTKCAIRDSFHRDSHIWEKQMIRLGVKILATTKLAVLSQNLCCR